MVDDKKNEDLSDEDFDLESLEDEDDLTDEDWDEYDDAAPQVSDAQEVEGTAPVKTAKKRSFLSSNFTLIVVSVAVLGGGYIVLNAMTAPQPGDQFEQPADELAAAEDTEALPVEMGADPLAVPEDTALSEDTDAPPMPVPMDSESTELESQLPALEATAETDPNALTPMPTAESLAQTELESLEIDAVPAEPPQAPADELSNLDFETVPTEPAPQDESAVPDLSLPGETTTPETGMAAPESADNSLLPQDLAAAEETPAAEALSPAPEMPAETEIAETIPAADPVPTAPQPEQDLALEQMRQEFEAQTAALQNDLSGKNAEIESLNKTVTDLKAEIESLKASQKEAAERARQDIAAAKAAAKETEVVSAPAAKPREPAAKPATPPAQSMRWTLRSAQPGKAVLSMTGSEDMRTVEVGDTLSGLGRITSITQQNGRWVVMGTQSTVVQ